MFRIFLGLLILGIGVLGMTGCAAKRPPVNQEEQRLQTELSRLSYSEPVRKAKELQQQIERFPEGDVRRQPLERQRQEYTLAPEWQAYAQLSERLRSRNDRADARDWAAAREALARRQRELRASGSATMPSGLAATALFNAMTFPRMDGSTSTQPLAMVIASRALGCDYGWLDTFEQRKRMGWMSGVYPPPIPVARIAACARLSGQRRTAEIIDAAIAVNASTHQAYVNLIEGACDVNLTVRKPSADEADLARRRGVVLEMEPIALDALVFMVNSRNPINSLSGDQLRAIYGHQYPAAYAGAVRSGPIIAGWPGPDIMPVVREPNSGSRELFEQLVLGNSEIREENEEKLTSRTYALSMTGPFDVVSIEPHAIGYSVHYYEQFMAISPSTRAIAIDGILPSRETIASGRYPYVFPIYLVYRQGAEANSPGMQLLRWLKTQEGQAAIGESGYVPATLH